MEPSSRITYNILHLPNGSLLARYLNIFIPFAISGIFHKVAGIAGGMSVREYGVLQFFFTQTLGIMIEDGVQACYSRLVRGSGTQPRKLAIRCLGYAWVASFLVWSSPAWLYPQALRPVKAGANGLLPYSIVQTLRP